MCWFLFSKEGMMNSMHLALNLLNILCAVLVLGNAEQCPGCVNVALNKPAYQSTTAGGNNPFGTADLAVDGIEQHRQCTHTIPAHGDWWLVDLEESYDIQQVQVLNRGDCCGNRLADFYIRVGDSFPGIGSFDPTTHTLCQYQGPGLSNGEKKLFTCDQPIRGRYVTVNFPSNRRVIMTLCEVWVFAEVQVEISPLPAMLRSNYELYTGPERNYRTLSQVRAVVMEECMVRCTLNQQCNAVKVNQEVRGHAATECLLLAADDAGDLTTSDIYLQKES